MHKFKNIVGTVTPLLLILGIVSLYVNNQVNITTYAQPALRTALEANGTSSFRDWDRIENERVSIRYHRIDKEEVEMVLGLTTNIRQILDQRYQFTYNKPLNIAMVPTRDEMRQIFNWDATSSAVGVYYGNRIYLLAPSLWINADSIEELSAKYFELGPIAHEYTHFIMDHKYHNNLPRWYNEGVAQYEEYLHQGYVWIEDKGTLDQDLYSYQDMKSRFDNLDNQPLSYHQAFTFVEFQLNQYGEELYWELMKQLEKRIPFEQAFATVYGEEVIDVWDHWKQYIAENQVK